MVRVKLHWYIAGLVAPYRGYNGSWVWSILLYTRPSEFRGWSPSTPETYRHPTVAGTSYVGLGKGHIQIAFQQSLETPIILGQRNMRLNNRQFSTIVGNKGYNLKPSKSILVKEK